MKPRRLSTPTLGLLAVVLPLFWVFSWWAGLACSEGDCGVARTVLDALWLPILLAWVLVVGMLVDRWLASRR